MACSIDHLFLCRAHRVEHDRAIAELLVTSLKTLENSLRHVDVVRVGLKVLLSAKTHNIIS